MKRIGFFLLCLLCLSGCAKEEQKESSVEQKYEIQNEYKLDEKQTVEVKRETTTKSTVETTETTGSETETASAETTTTVAETSEQVRVVVPEVEDHAPRNTSYQQVILIGDSRTVGMEQAVNHPEYIWSAKVAQGYQWMKDTGVPMIESQIQEKTAVIIWMGVNDTYNIHKYISYFNEKAEIWQEKGADTYIVSVGPVEYSQYLDNSEIENFNQMLSDNLRTATYIDLYSEMRTNGYETVDGVHYTEDTYQEIFNILKERINL